MWNLKKKKRSYVQNRNRPIDMKTNYGYQRRSGGEKDKLEVWDEHIHSTMYKIDNQQGPTV